MKYVGVLAFVVFAATFLAISEASNSTWGYVGPRDILLHREIVTLEWKFLRVVSHDVKFYPRDSNRTITAIKAIDFSRGKNGGYATLMTGGPGFRNATIHLKSDRGHSLNFAVEIIGH